MHAIEPLSARLDAPKRGLPRLLQLRSDQAIVGIASSVATFGKRCIILGLAQLHLGNAPPILVLVPQHALGLHRRLDRHRRHGAQHLGGDRLVDALAAEPEAALRPNCRFGLSHP